MCGIDFEVIPSTNSHSECLESIRRRGPDAEQKIVEVLGSWSTRMHSTVLHLRGGECVTQPLVNERFALLWNGEAYDGLEMGRYDNDTSALFHAITIAQSASEIFSAIRGEYAFVLLDRQDRAIYYGRDVFGRRSLVQQLSSTYLRLTSAVPAQAKNAIEVPATGIWTVRLSDELASPVLIPWSHLNGIPRISRAGEIESVLNSTIQEFEGSLGRRLLNIPHIKDASTAHVAILFSGGIDSVILAAIADRVLPPGVPVDLINVAFENRRFVSNNPTTDPYSVPDRVSGMVGWEELQNKVAPNRRWNFVKVNVPAIEYDEWKPHVLQLICPSDTIMDLSIAIALWFAARGVGLVENIPYQSTAKVLLLGMGADEQLGGYSRHRSAFERGGREALLEEMQMELDRIAHRNLGRDDRVISDHGKEARFPFLDEQLVSHLSSLPVELKCDFSKPRGSGEKILIRRMAQHFGFSDQVALLPKRAIQFGAKTAKMESSSERGDFKLPILKYPDNQSALSQILEIYLQVPGQSIHSITNIRELSSSPG
ncbi:putative asparagine synthase [Paramicrosporidium saccamoebae]|uniref:Putative asparagine synthase n=1 Tax=Paramicrosporidium saccamoebae TaxID=1246581 RepID=A0A2H9TII5_9FUNG|nr:putative asparagine synthase [Paramicrosporidium saccamoebae]